MHYLFLPMKSSKFDRHGLEDGLGTALDFICLHLVKNRKVLVHCDDG